MTDLVVLERLREIREMLGMLEAEYASISARLDRMGSDIERIKRLLDLVETP